MTGLLLGFFCLVVAGVTSWVIVRYSPWIKGPIAIGLPFALGTIVVIVAYRFGDGPGICGPGGDKTCIVPLFAAVAVALIYGAVAFFGSVGGGAWAWLDYRKRLLKG